KSCGRVVLASILHKEHFSMRSHAVLYARFFRRKSEIGFADPEQMHEIATQRWCGGGKQDPTLDPNAPVRIETSRDENLLPRRRNLLRNIAFRDWVVQVGIAAVDFQDRHLKPLGHTS